ncbi:MAG: hypothetical protein KAR83_02455 [Thermodesulfovibrionales bacterium]|nr:hypothetical protein [Thermodesulfovibrionales bacterium]
MENKFFLDTIDFNVSKDMLAKFDIVAQASWEKQAEYDSKDIRWSLYCSISSYINWIGIGRVEELVKTYNHSIETNNIISSVIIIRSIFESFISLQFLAHTLKDIDIAITPEQIESIKKIIDGVRHNTTYPWGGEIDIQTTHIMTMLEKSFNDNQTNDYAFLSNFCHPNYYPSLNILMTQSRSVGFSEPMKHWQKETSDRINKIQQYTIRGLQDKLDHIIDKCVKNLYAIKLR